MHSRESARYDGTASITSAPKLHRLTPVPVPFVLLPHRKGSALRWSESGRGAGRELKLLGSVGVGFGTLPLLLALVLAGRSAPTEQRVVLLLIGLSGTTASLYFLIRGWRLAATTRVLEIAGEAVRLGTARGMLA